MKFHSEMILRLLRTSYLRNRICFSSNANNAALNTSSAEFSKTANKIFPVLDSKVTKETRQLWHVLAQHPLTRNAHADITRLISEITKISTPSQNGSWDESVVKKQQELSRLQEHYSEYTSLVSRWNDCLEMLRFAQDSSQTDTSLIDESFRDFEECEEQVKESAMQTLMQDDSDQCDCFVEIHAGAGGTESQDWTEILSGMYKQWAQRRGYKLSVVDKHAGEVAGLKSITMSLKGLNAYGWMRHEMGPHRLVRVSPFDTGARRHTSFATVTVYPQVKEGSTSVAAIVILAADINIDVMRSGGAGGQHLNTTESAVRITHKPTGIVVKVSDDRSQLKNRQLAMKVLQARLYQRELDREAKTKQQFRGTLTNTTWGAQIRSYVLTPYQMVKDARTGVSTSNTDAVLRGDIDDFLFASVIKHCVDPDG